VGSNEKTPAILFLKVSSKPFPSSIVTDGSTKPRTLKVGIEETKTFTSATDFEARREEILFVES
jgi:hypothetical protein